VSKLPKFILIGIGWIAVGLGFIGVFLPLLPTTPFLLIAAWAFAHSSPRFRGWLLDHPVFGRMIRDWQDNGAIPLSAKILAVAMISGSLIWLLVWSGLSTVILAIAGICLLGAASFILSRPTAKKDPAA
jgi:hypothetical protein